MGRIQILVLSGSAVVLGVGGVLAWQGFVPGIAFFKPPQHHVALQVPIVAKKPASAKPIETAALPKSAPIAKPAPIPPQFDTVRVEPSGDVVVAGHGEAGAKIALMNSGNDLGETKSGEAGDFVILPQPLAPGSYVLSLRSTLGDAKPVMSRETVSVLVPAKGQTGVVVAVNAPGKPPQILAAAPRAVPASTAPAPASMPKVPAPQVTAALASAPKATETAKVARGDSLWRISRKTLGAGIRYPLIYHANAGQIHNPNLIYPGQVFVLPH